MVLIVFLDFLGERNESNRRAVMFYTIQNVFFSNIYSTNILKNEILIIHKTFESEWNWIRFLDFVKKIFVDCEKF